jgi:DNA-binding MarR family transcriptional regulator
MAHMTLRDRLAPILDRAINDAVLAYRAMLLDDGIGVVELPTPSVATARAAIAHPSARSSSAAGAKKRTAVQRDAKTIASFVESVYRFIADHPGLGAEQIGKEMGGDKVAVGDALKRLRARGQVITTGERAKMTYRSGGASAAPKANKTSEKKASKKKPAGAKPKRVARAAKAPGRKRGARLDLTGAAKRVLAYIGKHPGVRAEEIRSAIGGDANVLYRTLRALRKTRRVKTQGATRSLTYAL